MVAYIYIGSFNQSGDTLSLRPVWVCVCTSDRIEVGQRMAVAVEEEEEEEERRN